MTTADEVRASKARAVGRNDAVRREAGKGHILTPGDVPRRPWRTDLVEPLVAFVVYGIAAPQGSKVAYNRGGKVTMAESSHAVDPWRASVRAMVADFIRDWNRTHTTLWQALDEPVMCSLTVTVPATAAATKRGDRYATGTPDLDKLQRAVGDAISPEPLPNSVGKGMPERAKAQVRDQLNAERRRRALVVDDSRIVAWDHCQKVYPSTTYDSLAHPGVVIQLWRMSDLDQAARSPLVATASGYRATAADLRAWTRPTGTESWDEAAARLLPRLGDVDTTARIHLTGRTIGDDALATILALTVLHGPNHIIDVNA